VLLSDQAIDNLGIKAKAIHPQTYWKTIQVPGMVVDQPGRSDRSVVSPVTGVVTKIDHFPGDTVRPGETLFSIRLLSESLHLTQSDLFKATQEIVLARAQRERLNAAAGAVSGARIIEADNQISRWEVSVKAYRQELLNRGLTAEQIASAADGEFVSEITIVVPPSSVTAGAKPLTSAPPVSLADENSNRSPNPTFEMEDLKAELGQQVQAGQTLCLLANHQTLMIEGRAFRDETPLLERSVKEGWPVEVDFQEDVSAGWPPLDQVFYIRYIANTIDPTNRTFAFRIPLENQSRTVEDQGPILWRFRPGQKLRVLIRIDRLENVFVLPAEGLSRDGAEAFVFTQNVNTFERKAVRVIHQDRQHAVVANDGALLPGMFVVQNAAAQLNRMAKSQLSGVPKGYHVHADGSLHKNEDEGK
jgi:multidrug efflux pump subunit AcrA (membrane-fusion protein)